MRTLRVPLVGLMLVAATVSCRPKGAATSVEPDPDTPVVVEVENHFHGDVIIYFMRGTQRQRLGMVSALSTAAFTFPWRRLGAGGNNRLLAYPLAGARAYASDPLNVQPGQSIKWTLQADLDRSSLTVW